MRSVVSASVSIGRRSEPKEAACNKLDDLQAELYLAQVYLAKQIDELVWRYVGGAECTRLDSILDACVAVYRRELDEDGQVAFKGNAKSFIRTYGFLSAVLPYRNAGWEQRSILVYARQPSAPLLG